MGLESLTQTDSGAPRIPTLDGDWDRWVSATATRNFALQDPVLDWLNLFGDENGFKRDHTYPDHDQRTDFTEFVFFQGRRFEEAVVAHLGMLLNLFGDENGFKRDHTYPDHDQRTDFTEFVFFQGRRFEEAVVAHLGMLLNLFGDENGFKRDHTYPDHDQRTDFTEFVFFQGRRFEEAVVAHLGMLAPSVMIGGQRGDARDLSKAEATFDAMCEGAPTRDPTPDPTPDPISDPPAISTADANLRTPASPRRATAAPTSHPRRPLWGFWINHSVRIPRCARIVRGHHHQRVVAAAFVVLCWNSVLIRLADAPAVFLVLVDLQIGVVGSHQLGDARHRRILSLRVLLLDHHRESCVPHTLLTIARDTTQGTH